MAEKDDKLERLGSFDTLPPPASGDAYSAETVQRVVPPELLAEAKRELLKRGPRPAPKQPAPRPAPNAPALAAPPVPVIERIFEEDSVDDAETQMRPSTRNPMTAVGAAGAMTVGHVAPEAQPSADAVTSPLNGSMSPPRKDGWFGSALIFLGSMLLVLLAGLLLMRLLGSP